MKYVDKNVALRNLANSNQLFEKNKNNFLKNFNGAVDKITNLVSNNLVDELYNYISSIRNLALNVGAQVLYDDANIVLDQIKKDGNIPSLEQFVFSFRNTYFELENI